MKNLVQRTSSGNHVHAAFPLRISTLPPFLSILMDRSSLVLSFSLFLNNLKRSIASDPDGLRVPNFAVVKENCNGPEKKSYLLLFLRQLQR